MKTLLAKIYVYRIFSELILLYPLYNVMFADAGHLSTFQISTLLTIWAAIILVAEVPSGALADRYSRRNLLVLAQVLRAVGYFLWLIMPNYIGFLAGLALWGVGRALTSGTFEALVFDELKSKHADEQYAKVIGRTEGLALLFSLVSTLAATPVFLSFGYAGVLWGSIASVVISSIAAATLPHRPRQKDTETPRYLAIMRNAATEVRRSPALLRLILFGVFVGMLFRVFDEYASLIIHAGGIAVGWVPVVSALVFAPVILAGFAAHRFEHLRRWAYLLALAVAGAILVGAGAAGGLPSLVLFSLFMLFIKLAEIIFGARVQHAIRGEERATITSINGFGVEISAVAGFLLYGVMAQLGGTGAALATFGYGCIAAVASYLLLARFRNQKEAA